MADQQQQDEIDRAMTLPETLTTSDFDPTLPTDIATADGLLIVNSAGTAFEIDTSIGTGSKQVSVSSNDTSKGYLNGKLVAGTNITFTENNDGSAETLSIGLTTPTISPVLTTPEINDTSADHQYVFAVNELAADRTITLPLLGADDTFVFQAHSQTLTNKTIDSDNNTITNIVNADIKTAAAIALNKLAASTASRALQSDGSGFIEASSVTTTELGYVSGVTSAIQTQIDSKLDSPITTTGDIIYSSSGTTPQRLGIGSLGEVLTVSGGIPTWSAVTVTPTAVSQKTANYTATTSDEHIEVTSNSVTITLFAVASNSGSKLTISNTGTGVVTIDPNSSETFNDGSSQKYLSQDQSVELQCNGSEWIVKNFVELEGLVKDQKASSTDGGTLTSGAWRTRDLNTTSGDFLKFGSLSSNRITLDPGSYIIEATSPAYNVGNSKCKIEQDPAGTPSDLEIGSNVFGSGVQLDSHVKAIFDITSSTTFELQHRSSATQASNGFGVSMGVSVEVYSQVRIRKLV
jgi:hypothetical protein